MSIIIGIAGGTGSGKTTLARKIQSAMGENTAIIHQDSYYRDHADLPLNERHGLNFDHPDAFDSFLLIEQIRSLHEGIAIEKPIYNFHTHARQPETERVEPRDVILVEGILIFYYSELRPLMELKLYVDNDPDVRFIRRLTRDLLERGRSLESVVDQYLNTVRPMHLQFIEPTKRFADLIIPEGGHNQVAIDTPLSQIRARIRRHG
ncbi:MAG TPA: uridine kinase [Acidobacteriota bacterium]